MIPAGREALTDEGLAAAHGITNRHAHRISLFDQVPFPPVREVEKEKQGRLWDAEQVRAWVAGDRPIPALPTDPDPHDLFDAREACARFGVTRGTWRSYVKDGVVPRPDGRVGRIQLWYRSTLDTWAATRPGQGVGGGRPRKSA